MMDIGSIQDWLKQGNAPGAVPKASKTEKPESVGSEAALSRTATAVEKEPAARAATRAEVETAMNNIQEFVQAVRRDINFSLDDGNGRVVVKVTDVSSGDVIRQIPSEEALKLAENLSEVRSLLFEAKA